MFARNVFALCAFALLAFVVCASAMPEQLSPEEIKQLGLIDDIIEYIREKMYVTVECIEDAYATCSDKYQNKLLIAKCTIEFIIHGEGKCAPISS